MNKNDAVAYLKKHGIEAMSIATLDRHRKENRILAGEAKGKTGMVVDYSEEALQSYLKAESEASAAPSQAPSPEKATQALAKPSFQPLVGPIRRIEIAEEVPHTLAKVSPNLPPLESKLMWTLEEASIMTGLPKGFIKDAIKKGDLRGGRVGQPFRVLPSDIKAWLETLF